MKWVEFTVAQKDPEFLNFSTIVKIQEDSQPSSLVKEFQVKTADPNPQIEIINIDPPTTVFALSTIPQGTGDIHNVKLRLSSNASLDFETLRLYRLELRVSTNNSTATRTLEVEVLDVNEPPQCDAVFQFPGAVVNIPNDLTVPIEIYHVVASDPDISNTLNYRIHQVWPTSARPQFVIDGTGTIYSNQGFDYQSGDKDFIVNVTVSDEQGASCKGKVRIVILPVLNHTLNFMVPSQSVTISEDIPAGSVVAIVKALGSDVRYELVRNYPAYRISQDGIIRTIFELDLEANGALQWSILMIRAFSSTGRSGTATVNVTVLDVNDNPPTCTPSAIVLSIPETIAEYRELATLSCSDADITNNSVSYQLEPNAVSQFKFRLQGSQLQVNNTLDYDSNEIEHNKIQYKATIFVIDGGLPPLTTVVQVLVMVTPVNEFPPEFQPPFQFSVDEDAGRGTVIGMVKATDRDWKHDSIRYSIIGADQGFSINSKTGALYLRRELDFEKQTTYQLVVQAEDLNQDVNPSNRMQTTQEVTIMVQNVNDNPPECNPFYETEIYSTLSLTEEILSLICWDIDGNRLTATMINGGKNDRFRLNELQLFSKNAFLYNPDGIFDPTFFELIIEVTDGKYSTTVLVIIHVKPWTTTVPTTTTPTTTRKPQVQTVLSSYWEPEPWFVAVMTVTITLALITLGLLIWKILQCTAVSGKPTEKMTQPLLQNTYVNFSEETKPQNPRDTQAAPPAPQVFDGQAQDPVTGRNYLFNTITGERRWT
ncbi:cadherin-related family member 4-like isoform X2 [Polyodon spathula]|uniref:cadherin-related family member 4-like isoform X2 n=1 Tax=Polyodon spathula TaxID=7913 RepID=UPI001B7E3EEB|nr:cadherin-related family member 4-like isoform X2 [Polyodon spathula]